MRPTKDPLLTEIDDVLNQERIIELDQINDAVWGEHTHGAVWETMSSGMRWTPHKGRNGPPKTHWWTSTRRLTRDDRRAGEIRHDGCRLANVWDTCDMIREGIETLSAYGGAYGDDIPPIGWPDLGDPNQEWTQLRAEEFTGRDDQVYVLRHFIRWRGGEEIGRYTDVAPWDGCTCSDCHPWPNGYANPYQPNTGLLATHPNDNREINIEGDYVDLARPT